MGKRGTGKKNGRYNRNNSNDRLESAFTIGAITKNRAIILGISAEGCPWRGTPVCFECPLAEQIPYFVGDGGKEDDGVCKYKCSWGKAGGKSGGSITLYCQNFKMCPCAKDQTEYLIGLGITLPEA